MSTFFDAGYDDDNIIINNNEDDDDVVVIPVLSTSVDEDAKLMMSRMASSMSLQSQRVELALSEARRVMRKADSYAALAAVAAAKRMRPAPRAQTPMEKFLARVPHPAVVISDNASTCTLEWPRVGDSVLKLRSWTINLYFDRAVEARMYEDEPCPPEEAARTLFERRAELVREEGATAWRFRVNDNAGWWLRVMLPGNTIHIRFEPAIRAALPIPDRVDAQLAMATRLVAFWTAQRAALARNNGLFDAGTRLELHSRRREDDWFICEIACDREFIEHLRPHASIDTAATAVAGLPPWVVARVQKRAGLLH